MAEIRESQEKECPVKGAPYNICPKCHEEQENVFLIEFMHVSFYCEKRVNVVLVHPMLSAIYHILKDIYQEAQN